MRPHSRARSCHLEEHRPTGLVLSRFVNLYRGTAAKGMGHGTSSSPMALSQPFNLPGSQFHHQKATIVKSPSQAKESKGVFLGCPQ